MSKIPQAKSIGEETFAQQCIAYKIAFTREWKFHPERNFRTDFCIECNQTGYAIFGVEIEGGTAYGKSRHSRGEGFENDCEKYNEAVRLGVDIYRFTTEQVKSAYAIDFVRKLLGMKK